MARARSRTDDAVLALLRAAETPLSAYQVLDRLRPSGVQSPPIVYRALERLEKAGQIHRLEGINAYFACCRHDHHVAGVVFAICTECRRVEEWSCEEVDELLAATAEKAGFALSGRTVEVRGLCAECRGAAGREVPQGLESHGPGCACGHGEPTT
jgi:Fur family zinc uptake transcriptional regulator